MDAATLRSRLNHPVIDADGHWLEFGPKIRERMREIGGDKAVEGYTVVSDRIGTQLRMSVAERKQRRTAQQGFWSFPTKNTRDRATAMLPGLLYERLDEFGFDYSILYPTSGMATSYVTDAATRRATCRAFNIVTAEHFADYADRLTPAAVIPMHTPEEAIAELEFVTKQLGLKVVVLASLIPRHGETGQAIRTAWRDVLALDSEHDYDPVWAKCVELGLSPTFHAGGRGFAMRRSPSNFVYNHIGHFAVAAEAVCKALFLGGVTRRFPSLKFAFLEGGAGWACQLYADLVEHWEKRNLKALEQVNPENLDRGLLLELAEAYGGPEIREALESPEAPFDLATPETAVGGIENLDDFSACEIERARDIRDLFVDSFYFGCESDDRMNVWAFNERTNHFGAQLRTLFGSDIGHFDVPDMARVLPESHGFVEEGLMTKENYRDFVFANPVHFFGDANPDFFRGTVVEKEAQALLSER